MRRHHPSEEKKNKESDSVEARNGAYLIYATGKALGFAGREGGKSSLGGGGGRSS